MDKRILTNAECVEAAILLREAVDPGEVYPPSPICIYGVPRGGIPVVYAMALKQDRVVDDPAKADVIVDDIVDSGATLKRYAEKFPGKRFLALADFLPVPRQPGQWLVFPWEQGETTDQSADDIVVRLLQFIGEDPEREGLKETPQRVLKAWKEWTSGYGVDPFSVIKTFEDGGENYDEMIVVKNLPFYSHCEHHLAPFFGTATIAYIPSKRIIGLSKLGRLLEIYARRLQVQERLTTQVANALETCLEPRGVAVLIKARHLCMESRGLQRQGHETVTSAIRGVFFSERAVRQEFLSLAQS